MSPAAVLAPSVLAVALATLSAGIPADALPQLARGEGGALAVAFGDARQTISRALVRKSDSYFHGGVDVSRAPGPRPERAPFLADPWRWINVRVRAPEVERHLEGGKAVELMPWLRASVASDPHNIDAWTTAWYIADAVVKDRALAARVIAEGRAKNPDSLELLLAEGRGLYQKGEGDVAAAERAFEQVRAEALKRCGGDVSKLPEPDAWSLRFAVSYLEKIRKGER